MKKLGLTDGLQRCNLALVEWPTGLGDVRPEDALDPDPDCHWCMTTRRLFLQRGTDDKWHEKLGAWRQMTDRIAAIQSFLADAGWALARA